FDDDLCGLGGSTSKYHIQIAWQDECSELRYPVGECECDFFGVFYFWSPGHFVLVVSGQLSVVSEDFRSFQNFGSLTCPYFLYSSSILSSLLTRSIWSIMASWRRDDLTDSGWSSASISAASSCLLIGGRPTSSASSEYTLTVGIYISFGSFSTSGLSSSSNAAICLVRLP